jgi:hypothetical protein
MMPRGLIAITRCGGVVSQARTSSAHVLSHFAQWRPRRGHGRAFASPSTGEFFRTDPRQAALLVLRSEHMIHRRPARYRRLLGLAQMS